MKMGNKIVAAASTGKIKQKVKPAEPMHYEFCTVVAIEIFDSAKDHGASDKGALFVVSHAALESGWATAALKAGDYNLFGIMTLGTDFKRTTKHGKVKDYSKSGGYKASMADYFAKINLNQWSGLDLIKKDNFTYDDVDKAFNTGAYYPSDKERFGGKYAYNADMDPNDKKNHYGEHLIKQLKSVKKLMSESLDYKIGIVQQDPGMTDDQKNTELTKPSQLRETIQGIIL
jgi:hypothetical protein